MELLTEVRVARITDHLARGLQMPNALPAALGATATSDGLWRFFSASWPESGIEQWNSDNGWMREWTPFLRPSFFAFGDDIFGNQLVLLTGSDNVFLWNHQNGECRDLLLGPVELLRTALD